jgi:hypothetical protein
MTAATAAACAISGICADSECEGPYAAAGPPRPRCGQCQRDWRANGHCGSRLRLADRAAACHWQRQTPSRTRSHRHGDGPSHWHCRATGTNSDSESTQARSRWPEGPLFIPNKNYLNNIVPPMLKLPHVSRHLSPPRAYIWKVALYDIIYDIT